MAGKRIRKRGSDLSRATGIPDDAMIKACIETAKETGKSAGENWGEGEACILRSKLVSMGFPGADLIETDRLRRWAGNLRRSSHFRNGRVTKSGRGQASWKEIVESRPAWYSEYLKSDHWASVVERYKKDFCQLDWSHKGPFDLHHNNYGCIYRETEDDVFTICRHCHRRHHAHLMQIPSHAVENDGLFIISRESPST